jgi:hypothetical protein
MNGDSAPERVQLPPGDYEVMVVDVDPPADEVRSPGGRRRSEESPHEERPDDQGPGDQSQGNRGPNDRGQDDAGLSVVILKGPLKGQVVELSYPPDSGDLFGLLGTLGTLVATAEGLQLRLDG